MDDWHSVAGVRALQQVDPLRSRTRDDRAFGLGLWEKRVAGRSFAAPPASTAPRALQLFVCRPSLGLPLVEPRSLRVPVFLWLGTAPALPWVSPRGAAS